ncbi:hypothetical protein FACS1894219_12380 [Clostridia bacterium]|nr:hypothetical protein FACS1894219_12380 [Clostridia bacterium]
MWEDCPGEYDFARPHDHLGEHINEYLPKGDAGKPYLDMMEKSYCILNTHEINLRRAAAGLKKANSIWLWSPGGKPNLPDFKSKTGYDGEVIAAVDLIKGIGKCAGISVADVPGATGNFRTDYAAKGKAAVKAFESGKNFVYVHVEAPDECGHRGEADNKVRSIEMIDERIIKPVYDYLNATGEEFRIIVLPDHPTPVALRTHTSERRFLCGNSGGYCKTDRF